MVITCTPLLSTLSACACSLLIISYCLLSACAKWVWHSMNPDVDLNKWLESVWSPDISEDMAMNNSRARRSSLQTNHQHLSS